jgi:outer membrane protein assembly factor BamB
MRFFLYPKMRKAFSLFVVLIVLGLSFLAASLVLKHARAASTSIILSPASGPPTTVTTITGTEFGSGEQVEIAFDGTNAGDVSTSATGGFTFAEFISKSTSPGPHIIRATGESSGLSVQAIFLVQTNWTLFGFNGPRTHNNPYENTITTANVSQLQKFWSDTTTGAVTSSPAIAKGIAYVTLTDGSLRALNNSTGQYIWNVTPPIDQTQTQNPLLFSSPAVANGIVYYAYVLDSSAGDTVVAFNAISGGRIWVTSFNNTNGTGEESSPVIANGVLYIGSEDMNLHALNAKTGAPIWTGATGGVITSSAAVGNGLVYIASADGKLYAFKAAGCGSATCAPVWTATTGGAINSTAVVTKTTVYVGSTDNTLYAFNATTGALIWKGATGGVILSSPALANGVVYIASADGKLYAFKAAGCGSTTCAPVWTAATTGANIISSPAVANGVVYLGSTNDNLYAFNAATGAKLFTFLTGGSIVSSPAVADGVVYVGSNDSNLYAFHL